RLALALLFDVAPPRLTAAALWAMYSSFVAAGDEFLQYQWDALLLETGLLAVLAAPSEKARRSEPPWPSVLLLRWLSFRIQFESGILKLLSGDRAWRDMSACSYHYETQPLPTPLGWYAHHLPRRVHEASTAATLAIECVASPLSLLPQPFRRI